MNRAKCKVNAFRNRIAHEASSNFSLKACIGSNLVNAWTASEHYAANGNEAQPQKEN